ncbi:hypothetical protein NKG05_11050 [Oerskovia sp. M15]
MTADPVVYSSMIDAMVPALLVTDPEDVDRLIGLWGSRPGRTCYRRRSWSSGRENRSTSRTPSLRSSSVSARRTETSNCSRARASSG